MGFKALGAPTRLWTASSLSKFFKNSWTHVKWGARSQDCDGWGIQYKYQLYTPYTSKVDFSSDLVVKGGVCDTRGRGTMQNSPNIADVRRPTLSPKPAQPCCFVLLVASSG